ncbi:inositol hexakisphosphate kinase 3 [Geranomyces michiganensis]|nr:inositol hexakisphosphate kinase 3 [Geranomyces michiganensis]
MFALPNGLIAKICSQAEIDFYTALFASSRPDLVRFSTLVPRFAGSGVTQSQATGDGNVIKEKQTIKLENLLESYTNASIADIKIGTRLHGLDATAEKQLHMENQAATTTSLATGLRICGIKIHDPATNTFLVHGKPFGRNLTAETLSSGIRTILSRPSTGALIPQAAIRALHGELKRLYEVLKSTAVRLWGASLLVVYEWADGAETGRVDVKVIDFAHSVVMDVEEGGDEGALFGVKNLLTMVGQLVDGHNADIA